MTDVSAVAEAAMRSSMERLDSVSRNVANANTHGFKREMRVQGGFDSHLDAAAITPRAVIKYDFSGGTPQFTGQPLHFAIEGKGWFQLESPQGVLLTRNGNFQLNAQGKLVSAQGWPVVLDGDASFSSDAITLRSNQELRDHTGRVARLELVDAPSDALEPAGFALFRSARTTTLEPSGTSTVRQGYLEGSNVNSLTEMVTLMEAMRQAEAAQRMLRSYDDAMGTALTTLGEF